MSTYFKLPSLLAFGTVLLLTLMMARPRQVIHAQSGCDASILTGKYTLALKGHVYDSRGNLYLLAQIGAFTMDGAGSFTGSDTYSADGFLLRRQLTGTYTVTAECTGTVTVKSAADNTEDHADIVISKEGKEVDWIQTDSNFINSGTLKRQAP